MPRQGLGKESILQAAIALIEEKGIAQFSMGELAKRLNVKPASLYNHVDSLHDLLEPIGLAAISRLTEAENQAIQGSKRMKRYSLSRRHIGFSPGSMPNCTA